jgi:hypothetical protein
MSDTFTPSIGAIREATPECSVGAIVTPEVLEEEARKEDGRSSEDTDSTAERQRDLEPTG